MTFTRACFSLRATRAAAFRLAGSVSFSSGQPAMPKGSTPGLPEAVAQQTHTFFFLEDSMSSSLKRVSGVLLTALLVLAWTAGAWAQAGTGEVAGIIFDPSGAVVAKAEITLSNDATGDIRKTQSTAAGIYRFSALPIVGTYTLTVTTPGFGEYKATRLTVSVGAVLTRDVHLQVGSAKEVINVEGAGDVDRKST